MYRYLLAISLQLLLLPMLAMGQTTTDTTTTRVAAEQPIRLKGIRVGFDLQPWVRGIASGDRDLYNVHLRLDAGRGDAVRYGLMLDLLHSEVNISDSATYAHKGKAARLGIYLNVIPNDPDRNLVTVGLGYGRSWFDERLSGTVKDPLYGEFPVDRSRSGLRAGWVELSAGMQARIWKQLYTGYNVQLKLFPHFKEDDLLQIYEIPGFGSANNKSSFGFSYFLLYRFGW